MHGYITSAVKWLQYLGEEGGFLTVAAFVTLVNVATSCHVL